MTTLRPLARFAAAFAIALGAGAAASAQSTAPLPVYNPAPTANLFPMGEGYSWTYVNRRGQKHDIRMTEYAASSRFARVHNLSGKDEIADVQRTTDQFGQPVVKARELDRRRNLELWGKLFQSQYSWTWMGTSDVTLQGRRRSTWYRSAVEPCGTFLRPLVYDIAPAPGVADAGISQIALCGGIGIIEQTFTTIAGPNTWELESAKTDAGQVPAILHGVETRMTINPPSFTWPGILPPGTGGYRPPMISVTFEAKVRAGSRAQHALTFMGGQRIEVEFYDETNRLVYSWGDGRAFNKAIFMTTLKDGSPLRFQVTDIPMPSAIMDPQKRYRVKAYLTEKEADGGKVRFSAQELMSVRAGV